jgi:hypothetical protein
MSYNFTSTFLNHLEANRRTSILREIDGKEERIIFEASFTDECHYDKIIMEFHCVKSI